MALTCLIYQYVLLILGFQFQTLVSFFESYPHQGFPSKHMLPNLVYILKHLHAFLQNSRHNSRKPCHKEHLWQLGGDLNVLTWRQMGLARVILHR